MIRRASATLSHLLGFCINFRACHLLRVRTEPVFLAKVINIYTHNFANISERSNLNKKKKKTNILFFYLVEGEQMLQNYRYAIFSFFRFFAKNEHNIWHTIAFLRLYWMAFYSINSQLNHRWFTTQLKFFCSVRNDCVYVIHWS